MGLITRHPEEPPAWYHTDMGCTATHDEPGMACWLGTGHEGEHWDNGDKLWWRSDPTSERQGPLTAEEEERARAS